VKPALALLAVPFAALAVWVSTAGATPVLPILPRVLEVQSDAQAVTCRLVRPRPAYIYHVARCRLASGARVYDVLPRAFTIEFGVLVPTTVRVQPDPHPSAKDGIVVVGDSRYVTRCRFVLIGTTTYRVTGCWVRLARP